MNGAILQHIGMHQCARTIVVGQCISVASQDALYTLESVLVHGAFLDDIGMHLEP